MIASSPDRFNRSATTPVHAEMADAYAREIDAIEAGPQSNVQVARQWLGEHPKAALGLAIGLGVVLGILVKRVRKW